MTHVPFIVEGLDDHGEPSGRFLLVVEVAVIDENGRELGRFRDPSAVRQAMWGKSFWKVKAIETQGEPRSDLTAEIVADE